MDLIQLKMAKPGPRIQEIKYNRKGEPYVTHYSTRLYLKDAIKTELNGEPVGVIPHSNSTSYVIKVDLLEEHARVWIE